MDILTYAMLVEADEGNLTLIASIYLDKKNHKTVFLSVKSGSMMQFEQPHSLLWQLVVLIFGDCTLTCSNYHMASTFIIIYITIFYFGRL